MMDHRSISNIAWPADRDSEALDLAAELGFSGIEVAPAKVFGSLEQADAASARRYRADLAARGLAVPAMQAILFGVQDVHLFTDASARARLATRLHQVAVLAAELGAGACVFGAPALRDPGDIEPSEAWRIATDFFREMAPRFAELGTSLCFEANPTIYKCRFVTGTPEAMALVAAVGLDGFSLQLDMGTVFANDEGPGIVARAAAVARHCHISEPHLVPLGSSGADHTAMGQALADCGYRGWISVEMRASVDWRAAVTAAAALIGNDYAPAAGCR